ncbi:MAG: calcium/sodium antiporter [Fidelibacterota bacterium]
MSWAQTAALLAGGAVFLYYGGNLLVKGASRLAGMLGVTPMAVGLTIVAFGTSLPELVVSLVAVVEGRQAMAIGNVVGSNIANVGLIIGLTASLFSVVVVGKRFVKDLHLMVGVSFYFVLVILDGVVARWEGLVLLSGIVIYASYRVFLGREESDPDLSLGSMPRNLLLVVLGIIGLGLGASMFVEGAARMARAVGVSELAIGLTVVAVGTSLPELATSLVAAFRKESDISVGNIVGSNLFNLMGVVGPVAVIRPLAVEREVLSFELPIMILFSLVLYPVTRMKKKIPRIFALLILGGYVAFLVTLFQR